jgi:hypothetical protein
MRAEKTAPSSEKEVSMSTRAWDHRADLATRFDSATVRQANVHEHHVRLILARASDGFGYRCGLANDGNVASPLSSVRRPIRTSS